MSKDQVLVAGPGAERELAPKARAVGDWVKAGGRVLALGLEQEQANSFLPALITMQTSEHIAAWFPPFSAKSLLAGVAPADVHNRDPRKVPLLTGGATPYGDGVLAEAGGVLFCQLPPFQVSKAMGALSSVSTAEAAGQNGKCARLSMGSLASAQFGQKLAAGQPGKTYTFAARVKALDEPGLARLEVERAGRPWDRAGRGDEVAFKPGAAAELHLTFTPDKAYPEGWQAYLSSSGEGARLEVDHFRLYEGDYVPLGDSAAAATEAPGRNLLTNVNFAAGLAGWYFNHGPEQFNLRRTFGRASFAVSRLLGNLGVAGATPLLERFGEPVGASTGPSVITNGNFNADTRGAGLADGWEFGSGTKGATCTREPLESGSGFAQLITVPAVAGDAKPDAMLAHHDLDLHAGQWYRMSLRTRAEGLTTKEVFWTVQNTANWEALFEYEKFAPATEWQTNSFLVQAKATAAKGTKFQIWFSGTGKLWLADVHLEPVPDPAAGRWLTGLYLNAPTEWDDPYRFFGW